MVTMHNRARMRDRARHQDLLDQVATSEHERREVRRILGAPLTEAELDRHLQWKASPPGTCPRTHQPCQTPQACEMAEPPRDRPHRRDFWRVALLLIGTWAATGLTLLALVKR